MDAADEGVEAGSQQRRHEAEPLAGALQRSVRIGQQLIREDRLQQPVARRIREGTADPVQKRDEIDQPEVLAAVDEQQQEQDPRLVRRGRLTPGLGDARLRARKEERAVGRS